VRFAERYPELRIVVDHGAKPPIRDDAGTPDPTWAAAIEALAALPQKPFCKLSGLATEASPGWTADTLRPYVDHLLGSFGATRMMWGSDWPVLNLNGDYAQWHASAETLTRELDEAARTSLFGGAAQAFYRL
jgi:L-fuconolactonase